MVFVARKGEKTTSKLITLKQENREERSQKARIDYLRYSTCRTRAHTHVKGACVYGRVVGKKVIIVSQKEDRKRSFRPNNL